MKTKQQVKVYRELLQRELKHFTERLQEVKEDFITHKTQKAEFEKNYDRYDDIVSDIKREIKMLDWVLGVEE